MIMELAKVRVRLNGREVLKDVSLRFDPGITVLLGENSSGKTTLLKTAAGLIRPESGTIFIDGKDIGLMKPKERARLIGYCWQNPYSGFFEENVKREVEFILKNIGAAGRRDVLEILGIEKLMTRNPFKLSGGEARRVSIASVIVADQPIILLDEPFNEMDLDGYISILKLLNMFKNEGKTVVVALNNALTIDSIRPEKVVVLKEGKVVLAKKFGEITEDELERNNIVTRRAIS